MSATADLTDVFAALGYRPGERIAVLTKATPAAAAKGTTLPAADLPAHIPALAKYAAAWFCPNPTRATSGKGFAADCTRLLALPSDLDAKAGGLGDMATVGAVIAELSEIFGTVPTVTIDTGHGKQALWTLADDPRLELDTPEKLAAARGLLKRTGRLVDSVAAKHGGTVDNVFNLDRQQRLPNTTNHKPGLDPVATSAYLPGGRRLGLDELEAILDAEGIPAYDEDTEDTSQVHSEAGDWSYAATTCRYVAHLLKVWPTDVPKAGRHQWMLSQLVRLSAAHRLGCITEADHAAAVAILTERFTELCATGEPSRTPTRNEVTDAHRAAVAIVEGKTEDGTHKELSSHDHPENADEWVDGLGDETSTGSDETPTGPSAAVKAKANELLILHAAKELAAQVLEARTPPEPIPHTLLTDVVDEPLLWRFDGLLAETGRGLLVAKRKTGKTTLVANLAAAYLQGTHALGRFPTTATGRNVAILNYEVSAPQVAAWLRDIGLPEDRVLLVNLRGRTNPFKTAAGRTQLAELLALHNIGLVVVDPFARAFTGKSQNDAAEVTGFLGLMDETVTAGGVDELIVCHHAGWEGERSRGSTALEDWPDTIITLVKDEDTGQRFLSAFGRDVEVAEDRLAFDPATRRLTLAGAGSRSHTRNETRQRDLVDLVVDLVTENPGANTTELATYAKEHPVGFQKGDIGAAAVMAESENLIRRERGKRGAWLHFPVTTGEAENPTYPDVPRKPNTADSLTNPPGTPTYPDIPPGHVDPTYPDPFIGVGGRGRSGRSANGPNKDTCPRCRYDLGSREHTIECACLDLEVG